MGVWRFPDRISLSQLIEIATLLTQDPNWHHYDVCIRQIAAHQVGICVILDSVETGNAEEIEQRYIDHTAAVIREALGNDCFGWDIAVPLWISSTVKRLPTVDTF